MESLNKTLNRKRVKIFLLYLFWIAFCSLDGLQEAGFFAHGGALTEWPYNIHLFFLPLRGMLLSALVAMVWLMEVRRLWMWPLALWLCFSFWHDGFYYETRAALDFPAYHFFSQSDTTTAVMSFGKWVRIAGQLISAGLATIFILNNGE